MIRHCLIKRNIRLEFVVRKLTCQLVPTGIGANGTALQPPSRALMFVVCWSANPGDGKGHVNITRVNR